jgi:hypothetical protein
VKPKTAFESGNSPPKTSESGALVQTGRGLEETKRRIMQAFEKARQQHPAHLAPPVELIPQVEYDERQATRFREKSNRLAVQALESSHTCQSTRSGVWLIEESTSLTPEELYKAALRRDK